MTIIPIKSSCAAPVRLPDGRWRGLPKSTLGLVFACLLGLILAPGGWAQNTGSAGAHSSKAVRPQPARPPQQARPQQARPHQKASARAQPARSQQQARPQQKARPQQQGRPRQQAGSQQQRSRAQPQAQPSSAARRAGGAAAGAAAAAAATAAAKPSLGQAIGLHLVDDPLGLRSSVALVVDAATGEPLFQKNARAVLPIASITKVMTAMVVLDAGLPLGEVLSISRADLDTERFSSSRLPVGTRLSRGEMLHLALMASENRAAHALGRHFPGGLEAFIEAMNRKARELGMLDTHFADPTGLSGLNVSNARDLAILTRAAYEYAEIRRYSTASHLSVRTGSRQSVPFRTTNRLIAAPDWDIGLQKTGYISEAGRCLILQARIDGRPVVIVLLDAAENQYRVADAHRLRNWLRSQPPVPTAEIRPDAQG